MEEKPDTKTLEAIGAISYNALQMSKSLVKPGARLLNVADAIEGFIKESGFDLSFPVNLSVNTEAAHYSPSFQDERVFTENDIVKVDLGAAKDGVLADCALTIDLTGNHARLVEASRNALEDAISIVKHGVKVSQIGSAIEKAIKAKGATPIINLGGHGVEKHNLHSGFFIPNFDDGSEETLEEGMVIAIEPFATTGKGIVTDGSTCEIYQFSEDVSVRSPAARKLLEEIKLKYTYEPFAVRWLSNVSDSRFSLYAGINELARAGAIDGHPTLIEVSKGMVSQAEALVLVEKDGCKLLTKAQQ